MGRASRGKWWWRGIQAIAHGGKRQWRRFGKFQRVMAIMEGR